ncbi:MAG: multicopper oxidase domain-containing protein [Bdellovibrionaceae bacterium]|nr:multicopper oxidase domain-containing protein [Bdellovibrionales bacterium]MCB9083975.1 multicopper oxidase domain-containing protein [Pseudobdellovibrionaceae bacterium]
MAKKEFSASRRELVKTMGVVGAGGLMAGFPITAQAFSWMDRVSSRKPLAAVDVELELEAVPAQFEIFSGQNTAIFQYRGRVLTGSAGTLVHNANSYLGPTIRVTKGQRVRIHFKNNLPEATIVHWHGLDVPADMDGHPQSAQEPGGTYLYEFTVANRAGLYWYHPHPHGRTGIQVYQGLAGLFIVEDPEEKALGLPNGKQEHIVVLQDRRFSADKQFEYIQSGHDRMMGLWGDTYLINGALQSPRSMTTGSQRIRVLNGSNARIYKLQWSHGANLTVIGTDGGLLDGPQSMAEILMAPGERLDLWLDVDPTLIGQTIVLKNLIVPQGEPPENLVTFQIVEEVGPQLTLPSRLSELSALREEDAVNFGNPKRFTLEPTRSVGWSIDGLGYEMGKVRPKETIQMGTMEIWEFHNPTGMPHPMHIHGSQFQILGRERSHPAIVDRGWKDVVLVLGGDTVRVLKRFDHHKGLFVFHCHNLEHEDMSMMRDYLVV